MYTHNVRSNEISSIMVPQGTSVELFDSPYLTEPYKANPIVGAFKVNDEMDCINLRDNDFEDRVSSLSVWNGAS